MRALDRRRFDDWLSIFTEDGYYAVLREIEKRAGNNVLLVGEDMRRLRARVESGVTRDRRRMLHTIGWHDFDAAKQTLVAGFTLWLDGRPSISGQYEMETNEDATRIRSCTVVLDGRDISDTIYLPI